MQALCSYPLSAFYGERFVCLYDLKSYVGELLAFGTKCKSYQKKNSPDNKDPLAPSLKSSMSYSIHLKCFFSFSIIKETGGGQNFCILFSTVVDPAFKVILKNYLLTFFYFCGSFALLDPDPYGSTTLLCAVFWWRDGSLLY